MDWLKEMLKGVIAEDQIDTFVESFKKEFPKHAVPKSEFNTLREELKIAKTTAEQTATTLEQLKTEAGSVEEYKTKLAELGTQLETVKKDSEKQISNVVKKVNFEKLLIANKMNEAAVGLVVDKVDFDSVLMDQSGNIVDADKHIAKMKESYSPLFLDVTNQSDNTDKNKDQKPPQRPLSEMSMEEYAQSVGMKGIK